MLFSPMLSVPAGTPVHSAPALGPAPAPAALVTTASLSVPALNSLPSAPAKLFIDFDGDTTATFNSYSPGTTPAYDLDNDTASFNAQELANMQEIWARVSEIYSPFNINVTTVDPGSFNNRQALKVVVGGNGAWLGQTAGGVAPFTMGAFTNFEPNLAFVFPKNLVTDHTKRVSLATAHEAGHVLGLHHQSIWQGIIFKEEYNIGNEQKAPIMGIAYGAERGLWWNGQSRRSWNIIQDDMAMIAMTDSPTNTNTNNFGYRADDHPSTPLTAELLNVSPEFTISVAGIIERTSDADYFSFTTDGGYALFDAKVTQFGPMLDLSLQLLDSGGTVLATSAGSTLSERIGSWLGPGIYSLGVLSAGSYGDVGQYTLSGTLVPEPASATVLIAGAVALLRRVRRQKI